MSMRYQAGIVLPGYNALKVANAPTIGTATAGNAQASVTFTAPACVGGGAISSYTVFSNCGAKLASGGSSPLVVTGLTNCTPYTFKVIATNVYGPSYPSAASNSATPSAPVTGQQNYQSHGTFSWVAPTGVTSVSVVAVGGSGGAVCYGGGGGGGLGYKNNYSVTPGNSYTVVVGYQGNGSYSGGGSGVATNGNQSYFVATCVVRGGGGAKGVNSTTVSGGTFTGDGGGNGGSGRSYGGGGAAGYSGNGGDGGYGISNPQAIGQAGSGGGGGGGSVNGTGGWGSSGGGGVGILGQGTSGGTSPIGSQGKGGSGGANGGCPDRYYCACQAETYTFGGTGGFYGGGGSPSLASGSIIRNGCGRGGAVRIIWPGSTRSYPSTNTGDL